MKRTPFFPPLEFWVKTNWHRYSERRILLYCDAALNLYLIFFVSMNIGNYLNIAIKYILEDTC